MTVKTTQKSTSLRIYNVIFSSTFFASPRQQLSCCWFPESCILFWLIYKDNITFLIIISAPLTYKLYDYVFLNSYGLDFDSMVPPSTSTGVLKLHLHGEGIIIIINTSSISKSYSAVYNNAWFTLIQLFPSQMVKCICSRFYFFLSLLNL